MSMSGTMLVIAGTVLLAALLGWAQQRAYQREVNRLIAEEGQDGQILVSGRAKGKLRGAIVLLIVDRRSRHIHRAVGMAGASVFARFHAVPELAGTVSGACDRAPSKALRRATADAVERYARLTKVPSAARHHVPQS
jgi:glucitol operon activator protein